MLLTKALRSKIISALLACLMVFAISPTASEAAPICSGGTGGPVPADEAAMIEAINTFRAGQGLSALIPIQTGATLDSSRSWATHMATTPVIEHAPAFKGVYAAFLTIVNAVNADLGSPADTVRGLENVGIACDVTESMRAYIGSTGHRANLVDPEITHVSVAVVGIAPGTIIVDGGTSHPIGAHIASVQRFFKVNNAPAPTPAPTTPPATDPAPTTPPATDPAPTTPPATDPAPTTPPATAPAPTTPPATAPTTPPATAPTTPPAPAPTTPPAPAPTTPPAPAPTPAPTTTPVPKPTVVYAKPVDYPGPFKVEEIQGGLKISTPYGFVGDGSGFAVYVYAVPLQLEGLEVAAPTPSK